MNKHVVWKYKVPAIDRFQLELPVDCNILFVRRQGADVCMWVQCDPEAQLETRCFTTVVTGHKEIDNMHMNYINTYFTETFVWHLYEDLRKERKK